MQAFTAWQTRDEIYAWQTKVKVYQLVVITSLISATDYVISGDKYCYGQIEVAELVLTGEVSIIKFGTIDRDIFTEIELLMPSMC